MEKYTFWIEDDAKELKQHINLTNTSWLVIENDIDRFYSSDKESSFSGFMNTIFTNFYASSAASISMRFVEKVEELQKLYSSPEFKGINEDTINLFIDSYSKYYESSLKNKALSYPKGEGRKFRINGHNLNLLRDSLEAIYYENSIGLYLKAIFEEYASLDSYKREQIFFKENYETILLAINQQNKIKISLDQHLSQVDGKVHHRKFYISPYKIIRDPTNTYNYIVGFSEEIKELYKEDNKGQIYKTSETGPKTISCIRLSRIDKCDIMTSMGAHISKDNASLLDEEITKRGPQFMTSEIKDITVRFSDYGLESLKRQLYMKPNNYDVIDKYTYVFHCTEVQALNYFFKFGKDIEIITPTELRELFIEKYKTALDIYKK